LIDWGSSLHLRYLKGHLPELLNGSFGIDVDMGRIRITMSKHISDLLHRNSFTKEVDSKAMSEQMRPPSGRIQATEFNMSHYYRSNIISVQRTPGSTGKKQKVNVLRNGTSLV